MSKDFQLEIVTAESEIYSGPAEKLFVSGIEGELEILYNHAPLLTMLAPGPVWVLNDNEEEGFVIFGGMMEVQPHMTIILADAALRAHDIDEAAAMEAKDASERALHAKEAKFDYAKAKVELAEAIAQLRAIKKTRKQLDSSHQ